MRPESPQQPARKRSDAKLPLFTRVAGPHFVQGSARCRADPQNE